MLKMIQQVIHVKVDRDSIDHGYRKNSCQCPIANALRKQFPNVNTIVVGSVMATIGDRHYKLPDTAKKFIGEFDWNFDSWVDPVSETLAHVNNMDGYKAKLKAFRASFPEFEFDMDIIVDRSDDAEEI